MKIEIIHIYENDFGCEERTDDSETLFILECKAEDGSVFELSLPDSFLTFHSLDEGVVFDSSILP